ncbi:putative ATPase, partial [Dipsacomyces acuminosporus]
QRKRFYPKMTSVEEDHTEQPIAHTSPTAEKQNLRDLRSKAMAQYESLAEDNENKQRVQRLNFLLEKSAAYVSFVSKKLETKRHEKRSVGSGSKAKRKKATGSSGKSKRRKNTKSAATNESDNDNAAADEEGDGEEEDEEWIIDGERVSPRQPKLITGGVMREYQLEGMEWLASLYENGLNGILADEMGLGKTLQTIGFLSFLRERKVYGPFLVLCPLSTLSNWVSEFYRFTPKTPVLLYHGTPEQRRQLRKKHLTRLDESFPVFIIVDEGHRIKNMNCKLIKDLKSYQSSNRLLLTGTPLQNSLSELWSLLNFLLPDIFDDLESFQNWFDFNDINEQEGQSRILSEEYQNNIITKLHHILQPFLLRRLKVDVEKYLPPKREYLISCPMTPLQFEYYQAIRTPGFDSFIQERIANNGGDSTCVPGTPISTCESTVSLTTLAETNGDNTGFGIGPVSSRLRVSRNKPSRYAEKEEDDIDSNSDGVDGEEPLPRATADGDSGSSNTLAQLKATALVKQMNLKHRLMQYRKVCQHPYLFDFPVSNPSDPESEYRIDEQLVRASGKLLVLDRLLPELFKNSHRVLIFSQFSRVLDILEFYAELRHWKFCRIDGNVNQQDRQDRIMEFNMNRDIPLFFLTTRSGGLGINLTSADTVVIFDSDWNPQQDLQAQDRVHRIGQKNPVIIYRLIIAGSCEKSILKRANAKRKLEKLVIHKRKFKGLGKKTQEEEGGEISVQDIANILMDDDTDLVEKDQLELKSVLEKLGPNDKVPQEAILNDEELNMLTDRSPQAYVAKQRKENVDIKSRFEQIEQTRDERNDMLAAIEPLT